MASTNARGPQAQRRTPGWLARATAVIAAVLALGVLAPVANAQDEDLPGRVGRVADFAGPAWLSSEDQASDWDELEQNRTIVAGDNLWVEREGRLEVDYGGGQFRLAGDTNAHVARLDDRTITLFVAQGRAILRVRVLDPGDVARIDTPNAQFEILRPGLYRVEVTPDRRRSSLVVREGEANAQLPSGIHQVLPGQTADVEGDDNALASVRNGFYQDGFDTWSANRDRRYERSRTATYVSRQMIGYADLDEYGRWQTSPQYGPVWFPEYVATDWAPYRYGRWSWVSAYGWTWVDDAPWGYAPFHYGRWVYVSGRWGWCPGAFVPRPVWAPALVAWYGGPSWSFSATVGGPVYGWVPLAWGEPYVPGWRCSDRCWTRYNRPYAVNVAERPHAPPTRYANYAVPGAITAVAGATFLNRQPVHRNAVSVSPNAVANAPVLGTTPAIGRPGRIPGAGAPVHAGTPPPASTFYPTRKPLTVAPGSSESGFGRGGAPVSNESGFGRGGAPVRSPGAAPITAVPPAGGVPGTGRPVVRGADPGLPLTRQGPASGAPQGAAPPAGPMPRTVTPAPAPVPGGNEAGMNPPRVGGSVPPAGGSEAGMTGPAGRPGGAPRVEPRTPRTDPGLPMPRSATVPSPGPATAMPAPSAPVHVAPPTSHVVPPAPQPRGMPQPAQPGPAFVPRAPAMAPPPPAPAAPVTVAPAPPPAVGGPPPGSGGGPVHGRSGGGGEGPRGPAPRGDPNAPAPVPR